jgi:exodeoxyribonuclease-3
MAKRRLRVATWNINSVRLRLTLLTQLIAALDPDVICLQETKVPDPLFPLEGAQALGYAHVAYRGMKGYNGVSILSRVPFEALHDTPNWCGRGDCRHLGVRLAVPSGPVILHNFYVPAGGDIPEPALNDKFAHKLAFLAEAEAHFAAHAPHRSILVGDLNIAPLEHDVWNHRQLLKIVSHTPEEIERLNRWLSRGFHDAVRHFVPQDQKLYSWWSYRNQDWRGSDRGRRLDHIWVSEDLVPTLRAQTTLKDARDWPRTSDHVPVCVELQL